MPRSIQAKLAFRLHPQPEYEVPLIAQRVDNPCRLRGEVFDGDCVVFKHGDVSLLFEGNPPKPNMGKCSPKAAGTICQIAAYDSLLIKGSSINFGAVYGRKTRDLSEMGIGLPKPAHPIRAAIEIYDTGAGYD